MMEKPPKVGNIDHAGLTVLMEIEHSHAGVCGAVVDLGPVPGNLEQRQAKMSVKRVRLRPRPIDVA